MNYTPKSGLNVPVITVLDDSGRVIADGQRLWACSDSDWCREQRAARSRG